MKTIPVILACIAVIVASAQAWLTWRTRNFHVESIVAGRQLDACAEIGAAATELSFRAQAAREGYSEATFRAVSEAPKMLAKASYMAAYLLPQDAAQDAAQLREISQRIVAALAQRDEAKIKDLTGQFDAVSLRVQDSCKRVIEQSLFRQRSALEALLTP